MWLKCKAFEAIAALDVGLRVQTRTPHGVDTWIDVYLIDGVQGIWYDFNGKSLRLAAPGTMVFRREQADDETERELAGEQGVEQRVRDFLTTRASKKKTNYGKGQDNE